MVLPSLAKGLAMAGNERSPCSAPRQSQRPATGLRKSQDGQFRNEAETGLEPEPDRGGVIEDAAAPRLLASIFDSSAVDSGEERMTRLPFGLA